MFPVLLHAVLPPPVRHLLRWRGNAGRRRHAGRRGRAGRRRLLTCAGLVPNSGGLRMVKRTVLSGVAVAVVLFGLYPGEAAAGRTRFHYAPINACGTTSLKPDPTTGATGERISRFGTVVEPVQGAPRPTVQMIFRHPL